MSEDDGFEAEDGEEERSRLSPLAKLLIAVGALSLLAWGGVPLWFERQREGNEASAIGALKTIAAAQSLFRESDKENDGNLDYATLAELGQVQFLDAVLASGTKRGYVFRASYSAATSEFLWMATAEPVDPGRTGVRYFASNHEGVVYYTTTAPCPLDTGMCRIPDTLRPVGR